MAGLVVRPTKRLLGVTVAAAVVYFFAVNSLLVWLYMVAAMLLGLIPLGVIAPLLGARSGPLRLRSYRGHGFAAPLTEDRGRVFAFTEVELELVGSLDLSRVSLGPLIMADGRRLAATGEPGPNGLLIRTRVTHRGPVDITAVEVSTTWPLGLLDARRRVPLQASLLVHPRYTLVVPEAGGGGAIGGEDSHRRGEGDDIIGLREYKSGDSRRRIHWMTTARSGELMVVERAAPTLAALRLSLRLDRDADPDAVELAVHVAASVAASCVRAGRSFRLSLPDGPPEARRWSEALGRLARVTTSSLPPPAQAMTVSVRAAGDGVMIETSGGGARLPTQATAEAIEAALAKVL